MALLNGIPVRLEAVTVDAGDTGDAVAEREREPSRPGRVAAVHDQALNGRSSTISAAGGGPHAAIRAISRTPKV